jgi:hypothetical protein
MVLLTQCSGFCACQKCSTVEAGGSAVVGRVRALGHGGGGAGMGGGGQDSNGKLKRCKLRCCSKGTWL